MAYTKSLEFSPSEIELSEVAKALAHPARVCIVGILLEANTATCGQIVKRLPLSQSTVSQHLKELKDARIVNADARGSSVIYSLNNERWNRSRFIFNDLFKKNPIIN